jgi:acyl carrier protein
MVDKERILRALFMAVDEVDEALSKSKNSQLVITPETILVGEHGKLDSLGFVSFIFALEQKIEQELGVTITLVDERAMSQKDSPFETIGKLADYISLLLEEKAGESEKTDE